MRDKKTYTLIGADGQPYRSDLPGTLGGYRRNKIYGRLDCPSALRAIAGGGYVEQRVFFPDERAAAGAGFRPCAVCMPKEYARWRDESKQESGCRTMIEIVNLSSV